MAIGTATAIIGSAILGSVASASAASKQAKAAEAAGQLQYKATQDSLALQEKIYNQNRADNEWQRQIGMAAGGAIANNFGLNVGGYSTGGVSMTGGSTATPSTGYTTPGGQFIDNAPGAEQRATPGGATQTTGGGPDWAAYMAANPDVAAEYQRNAGDAKGSAYLASLGIDSPEAFAQYHYQNHGQSEGRALPTLPTQTVTQPQASGSNNGYTDPTAPNGYGAPVRMTMAPLDVSRGAYETSPGFTWQMEQGQNALDHIASAGGGIMSGQRQKAALRYSQGLAQQDYADWRNYTTGQFNADRNFNEAQFQTDRSNINNRYDTRNDTLLSLAGFGRAATAANQSAAQSFAANSSNLMTQGAQDRGQAGVDAANAWAAGANNIATLGLYAAGRMTGGGSGSGYTSYGGTPYVKGYDPAWGGG